VGGWNEFRFEEQMRGNSDNGADDSLRKGNVATENIGNAVKLKCFGIDGLQ
jgi:hypothetical protein